MFLPDFIASQQVPGITLYVTTEIEGVSIRRSRDIADIQKCNVYEIVMAQSHLHP